MAAPSIEARVARLATEVLAPRACAIALVCAGALVGWFGAAVGLVIGTMLDIARNEARVRGRIFSFLQKPEGEAPPEPVAGYAAAACLALRGEWPSPWPGARGREARRTLWQRLSREELPGPARPGREAERIVDVAERCESADLPALARRLALSEAPLASGLLADWAFAFAALGRSGLDPAEELALRAGLGDCGLGAKELLSARLKAFPGKRDPWTVLGLSPGAPKAEIKRAYRRLSRLLHPDASPGDGGERFRELQAAYSELSSLAGRAASN